MSSSPQTLRRSDTPTFIELVGRDGVVHRLNVDTISGYQTRDTLPLTTKVHTVWHQAAVIEGWRLLPGKPWPGGLRGILIALNEAPASSPLPPGVECVLALFAEPATVSTWVAQLEAAGKRFINATYV